MKVIVLLLGLTMSIESYCQNKTKVYLFHGQGSDERIFSKISLDSNYTLININYPIPEKAATLKSYAILLSRQIDTSSNYILIGMSMGGMICSELADILKPQKIIVISSAKYRGELPFHYRFQKSIPINKIIPKRLVKMGALILQPLVEPDRNKCKETFKSMLSDKDPLYLKRTADMIINWDKKSYNKSIIQIHGTKDHTLPIRNIKTDYVVKNGSHMMTLTRGEEINNLLKKILGVK